MSAPAPELTQSRRLLLVRNPTAGRRHGRRFLATMRALADLCCVTEVRDTQASGDAERIARNAAGDRFDLVVAAGGDGTVAEVMNGLAAPSEDGAAVRPGLAILPMGTANVLAHEMGLPLQPLALARLIAGGPVRALSLGRLSDGRFFGAMAGAGFDAEVVANVDLRLKRWIGKGAYALEAARRWFAPQGTLRVSVDGRTFDAASVVVSKGRYYAGRFVLAPEARLEDGLLHVCLFASGGPWRRLVYSLQLSRGRLLDLPDFQIVPGCRVSIEGRAGAPLQGDGDIVARLPVEIEIVENVIRAVLPEDRP